MNRTQFNLCCSFTLMAIALAVLPRNALGDETPDKRAVDYETDVAPVLRRNCYRCHGPTNQEASLDLSTRGGLLGVADSDEPIVVSKHVESSLLIARVTDEDYGDLMPPDGASLRPKEVALLKRWIEQGAQMPDAATGGDHWAYRSVRRPDVPAFEDTKFANPVDAFIERKRRQAGMQASEPADPGTLARRVSLALTGLPASLEDIKRLKGDPTDAAFAEYVETLMNSEAFGQHWARHWLDLARYADSNGYQADQLRDSWAYRDWVVDAFNQDMPFDDFVIAQVAGDLLPDADMQSRIATGFHRTVTCNVEAGVHPESNRVQQVFDRVNTTSTVFLGSTLECAQCHDHKYDPFTQKDYYQLFAFFNNTPIEVKQNSGVQYNFVGPKMSLPLQEDQEAYLASLTAKTDDLRSRMKQRSKATNIRATIRKARKALQRGRASWETPDAVFNSNGDETADILDDGSVLITGSVPGSAIYRFEIAGPSEPISAIRLDAMRHDELPGGGPGRGDAERTNFVLNEFEAFIADGEQLVSVPLSEATASFSQQRFDVSAAIDGDPETGWAIAPKFQDAQWAEFRLVEPIELDEGQKLVISLDQHFGRGRVIGRPKISLLAGPVETADLTDQIVTLLQVEKPTDQQRRKLNAFFSDRDPVLKELRRKFQSVEAQRKQISPPETLVMVELDSPRETHVMERGNYLAKGEQVEPGTPASLHDWDPELPRNRLGLAQWLVDEDNPLLARVTINRLWAQMFGRAVVVTQEDFGTQAEPPTHPEMLDWLVGEFIDSGWSIRHVLKLMVLSDTFKQASRFGKDQIEKDPDNRWLSRGPRYRLPAEAIRDNALALSGLLSAESGGPPIMPYQPDGLWRAVGRNQPKWVASTTDDRYRRGLYVVWKRAAPYPSFITFDAPDRASCTVDRSRTNTPLQALVLMNDRAYAEAAVGFAQRILRSMPEASTAERVSYAYELATGRSPSADVLQLFVDLVRKETAVLDMNPELIKERVSLLPAAFREKDLNQQELALWFSVTSVLLNLDETITLN